MPSPLGHAMAGLAAGWLVDGRPAAPAPLSPVVWRPALLFLTVGMLPDIDLLFGAHSGPTHGIGAALIAGCAALAVTRRMRWGFAVGAAYASHILLDWLGTDTRAPIGIMALWPFRREYYESSLHVFMGVSRQYRYPAFLSDNLRTLARELLVLVPLLLVIAFARRRGGRGRE